MDATSARAGACFVALLACLGCHSERPGEDLQAREAVLQREVQGLRMLADHLDRGESVLDPEDVVVGLSEQTVQQMVEAQLPIAVDAGSLHVTVESAQVGFVGSASVTLAGDFDLKERLGLHGRFRSIGALEQVRVDAASATLHARMVIDHIDLEKVGAVEAILGRAGLHELADRMREQIVAKLPDFQIPVSVQQAIEFPAVSDGPLRVAGATLPLDVSVSGVVEGSGTMWIGVRVQPGVLIKAKEPAR
jgi:hypothetical protein